MIMKPIDIHLCASTMTIRPEQNKLQHDKHLKYKTKLTQHNSRMVDKNTAVFNKCLCKLQHTINEKRALRHTQGSHEYGIPRGILRVLTKNLFRFFTQLFLCRRNVRFTIILTRCLTLMWPNPGSGQFLVRWKEQYPNLKFILVLNRFRKT